MTVLMGPAPEWAIVRRDQCNGRTLSCVNCVAALGQHHQAMCHAAAKAYKTARG